VAQEEAGMDSAEALRTKLMLPPISQIGIVVRDMQKAVEYYQGVFGLGPWTVYESTPDKYWFKGDPSHMRLRQGKAMLGGIEIELVQPLEGESTFHEFLRQRGEGLHHLAFNVEDYEATVRRFEEAGFKPLLQAEAYVATYEGTVKACHFDTRAVGGVIFEIVWKSWLLK
jgi:catechol 2,3-dioxygenase-like lactoylglutathione lyase family enzyme